MNEETIRLLLRVNGSNLRLAVLGGVCRPWLASGVAIGSRAADRRAPSTIPAGIRRVTIHSSAFQGFAAYFIWTVFALVFVGGVFRRPATYTLLAVAVLGALALRLMARRRSSQPVSAVAEASR